MRKLRKQMNDILKRLNNGWIQAFQEAQESGEGVDLSVIFDKYNILNEEMNNCFDDAADRVVQKKRGLFGGGPQ